MGFAGDTFRLREQVDLPTICLLSATSGPGQLLPLALRRAGSWLHPPEIKYLLLKLLYRLGQQSHFLRKAFLKTFSDYLGGVISLLSPDGLVCWILYISLLLFQKQGVWPWGDKVQESELRQSWQLQSSGREGGLSGQTAWRPGWQPQRQPPWTLPGDPTRRCAGRGAAEDTFRPGAQWLGTDSELRHLGFGPAFFSLFSSLGLSFLFCKMTRWIPKSVLPLRFYVILSGGENLGG